MNLKTSFLKPASFASGTGLVLAMIALPAAALVSYEITDIGIPAGVSSHAQAINDLGQIAGFSDTNGDADFNNDRFGFIWQNNASSLLNSVETVGGHIGSRDSDGLGVKGAIAAIDDAGQVVGNYAASNGEQHAFVWQNGNLTDLGTLGGFGTTAIASNAAGQVWGNSENGHGFVWQNGAFTDLGPASQVYAVNSLGQAVIVQGGQYFLWHKDPVTGAETQQALAGVVNISPQAVNDAGQMAGIHFSEGGDTARLWRNGATANLATLNGAGQTHAYAINNAGQVVGFADIGDVGFHAVLWDSNGNPIDLNNISDALAQGLELGQAFSINNLGQIVGEAYINGTTHGFFASPIGALNWSAGSGAWDNSANWDSGMGLAPNALLDTAIQPDGNAVTVAGPSLDTSVNSLDLGGGTATATLDLNAGSLASVNQLTVHSNGILNFSAPNLSAGSIVNQGIINISGPGNRSVAGDVTNDGTFNVTETSVQYTGNFTNNGAYISDPSINQFNDLSVGADGYLVGGAGDQFIVAGNFDNASTQNALWNTADANLMFSGPSETQHIMGLAGVDNGAIATGGINNFAWGSLTLASGNNLILLDGNNTPGAALYASRFILADGVNQLNSISSDYNVYFDPTLPENQYLLLGSSGRFGVGNGQLLPWNLVPLSSDIIVDPSLTPNQQGFGAALDEACTAPAGILIARCLQLQGLSVQQKKAAIASLTPDQVPGQMAGPVKFGATRMDAPFSRLASLRGGGGSAPLSLSFNGMRFPTGKRSNVRGGNALGGAAGDDELFRDNPLGFFVQSRFNFGNMRNNIWDRGFDSQARAVTLGADYRINDRLVTGLAFNYTNSSTQYLEAAGHMNSDTYLGAFYGSYFLQKDFYVDWVANYGGNQYAFNRQYGFPGFAGQSSASPSGRQYSVALSSGKDVSWQAWTMGPYLRLEYLNMHIGEYRERGGNEFDMTTGAQTNHSFVSSLGSQVSYAISTSWGVITPSVRVEWEHQYLNDNRSIAMRLSQAAPGLGNFIIQTGNPDRDYVNLGGSVSATLPNGGAGFIRYETRLGQSNISDHILEAGLRLSF